MQRRPLLAAMTGMAGALAARRAAAQSPYAARQGQVSFVIPFPPGGPTDMAPRILIEFLAPELGTSIVPLNRAGAGGGVATEFVARSRPDGLTVLAPSNPPLSIKPALERNLPYSVDQFTPIGTYATDVGVLVARRDGPFRGMDDVIAAAKRAPDTLSYASPGAGSVSHIAMELFKLSAGIDVLHVPYAGSGPAKTAILAGNTQLASGAYSAFAPLFASGDLVPLATTARQRLADLAGTPTLAELGYPEATLNIWMGLFLPARTPDEFTRHLSEALATVARGPALAAALQRALLVPEYRDGAATGRLIQQEQALVAKVASAINLQL